MMVTYTKLGINFGVQLVARSLLSSSDLRGSVHGTVQLAVNREKRVDLLYRLMIFWA